MQPMLPLVHDSVSDAPTKAAPLFKQCNVTTARFVSEAQSCQSCVAGVSHKQQTSFFLGNSPLMFQYSNSILFQLLSILLKTHQHTE